MRKRFIKCGDMLIDPFEVTFAFANGAKITFVFKGNSAVITADALSEEEARRVLAAIFDCR